MNETPEQITERAFDELNRMTARRTLWKQGYIAGVVAEATRDKWIRVEDGLPEKHTYVLVYSEEIDDFKYDIGLLNEDLGWDCLGWNYPVTHWQPLPTPPSK
jgi:hypothetical protein